MTVTVLGDVTVRALAAALLHSLWQGALVAAVTALAWSVLRGSRPNVRYMLGCLALALMVTAWLGTAWHTAIQLIPRTTVAGQTAPARLGPAGPFDFSPAIRPIPRADLDGDGVSWSRRLDFWSVRVVPLWLVGVLILSLRLAVSWWAVRRIRRTAWLPVAPPLMDRARVLAHRLRIARAVRVVQSAAIQVPAVIGWLRPIVLLPGSALTGLSPAQLDAVIAHELAHVRRHDFALNLLQSAAEILLFYHPASWWISRRVRIERELCCDDVAVSLCGDRLLYATALADLESIRTQPTLVLAATEGPLLQRVRRLLAPSPASSRAPGVVAALVPAALVALVMTSATLTAGTPAPEASQATGVDRRIPADSGIVRGRVVDAQSGRPVANATVEIVGPEDTAESRSDDDGRFETRPIKAGTFTASAHAKGYVTGWYGPRDSPFGGPIDVRPGRTSSGIDIKMYASGAVNGRVVDARGTGLQGVEIVLEPTEQSATPRHEPAFAQTAENGAYRVTAAPGEYYVRAYVGEPLRTAKGERAPIFVNTFYPGVRPKGEAQPLRVDSGLDLYDIDITLATSALVRVRGRIVDPSGDSLSGLSVAFMNMAAGPPRLQENSAPVDADGRFELRDLTPGQYMINVRDPRRTSRWVGAMKSLMLDADVDDLEMRATTGARVVGHIVREPSSNRNLDFAKVRVGFEKRLTDSGFTTAGGAPIAADGTFETEAPGGPVLIHVDAPDGWTVKSIHLDRVDVDGQAVDVNGGTRQLQIVLTEQISAVSGVVVDRNGRALPGCSVVVFADDERRWTPDSRFVMAAQSSQAGQFRLKDVPPGDYLAVAVPNLPFRAWMNTDVLLRLQSIATKLKVNEGEQKVISIRASPTPDNLPTP